MIDASDSETQKGLEKGEIVADSVGFMLAGYETTSTTLAFATYLLAANAEVQERLANEIHLYLEENPVSDMHVQLCVLCCSCPCYGGSVLSGLQRVHKLRIVLCIGIGGGSMVETL